MAQQGTGGTKCLHIRVKVGEGVKATIKIPPSRAAAVLAELAKDPRAGSGVLLDKAGVNVLASEKELLPDDGPFEYLLHHGRPAQIDMDHLAGSPQLYVNLQLQHSIRNHDQDLACTVEALVDTGCCYDLVLPGNKVKHLQLEFVRDGTTTAFGGGFVQMAVFSPLKVTIKLDAPGGPQKKMGYLKPACIKREYDNAHNLDTVLRNKDRWQEFPKAVDKDGTNVLELSPVRRTRQAGVVPSMILGLSGLKELGLIVDAAHSQLLPLVEIGLIV